MNSTARTYIAVLFISSPVFAIEPYQAIESLLKRDMLPRIMNTEDIPDLSPNDPQPLFSPIGDYNQDGIDDVAIAGIYDLPKGPNRYYLMVGTFLASQTQHRLLYFREFTQPIYIHKTGTTGEGDPGDQAFSAALCSNCENGFDFYWNKKSQVFETRTWKARIRKTVNRETLPGPEVPKPIIDKSLQIVGVLPEVKEFVERLKKENRQFGVRVEPHQDSANGTLYRVIIYEKRKGKEVLFGKYSVNVETMQLVSKSKPNALGAVNNRR